MIDLSDSEKALWNGFQKATERIRDPDFRIALLAFGEHWLTCVLKTLRKWEAIEGKQGERWLDEVKLRMESEGRYSAAHLWFFYPKMPANFGGLPNPMLSPPMLSPPICDWRVEWNGNVIFSTNIGNPGYIVCNILQGWPGLEEQIDGIFSA